MTSIHILPLEEIGDIHGILGKNEKNPLYWILTTDQMEKLPL